MRIHEWATGSLALLGISLGVAAEGLDRSKPLICASLEAVECQAHRNCVKGTADMVNLPVFLRINFEQKVVEAARDSGEKLTSPILNASADDGALILQGVERGKGWNIAINQANGQMTATVSGRDVGFLVFGTCTSL